MRKLLSLICAISLVVLLFPSGCSTGNQWQDITEWLPASTLKLTPQGELFIKQGVVAHISSQDQFFRDHYKYWLAEVSKYEDRAVVVFSHGTDLGGIWAMETSTGSLITVEGFLDSFRASGPGELDDIRVVLVVCNPGKVYIPHRNVSYGRDMVWVVPSDYFDPVFLFTLPRSRTNIGRYTEMVHQ